MASGLFSTGGRHAEPSPGAETTTPGAVTTTPGRSSRRSEQKTEDGRDPAQAIPGKNADREPSGASRNRRYTVGQEDKTDWSQAFNRDKKALSLQKGDEEVSGEKYSAHEVQSVSIYFPIFVKGEIPAKLRSDASPPQFCLTLNKNQLLNLWNTPII